MWGGGVGCFLRELSCRRRGWWGLAGFILVCNGAAEEGGEDKLTNCRIEAWNFVLVGSPEAVLDSCASESLRRCAQDKSGKEREAGEGRGGQVTPFLAESHRGELRSDSVGPLGSYISELSKPQATELGFHAPCIPVVRTIQGELDGFLEEGACLC